MRKEILSKSFNENRTEGISLVVQWLRICISIVGGMGSTPGLGPKISRTSWCGQKKKKEKERESSKVTVCVFACFLELLVANFHFIYSSLTVIVMVCDISHIFDSPLEYKCLSKPLTSDRKEFTFGSSSSEVKGQKSPDLGKGVNLWGTGVVSVLA